MAKNSDPDRPQVAPKTQDNNNQDYDYDMKYCYKNKEKNKIFESISDLVLKIDLENNYDWEIPLNCPIEIPADITGNYRKNIFLKEHLGQLLNKDESLDAHYWLIQEWGGIRNFKKNGKNSEKIRDFITSLLNKKLTLQTFSTISSLSKVAAFLEPDLYSIYDSRVIFTLNWIILNNIEKPFLFPQPPSRNAVVSGIEIETLALFSKIQYSTISKKTAYFEYCNLLKEIATELNDETKPYDIEMALFVAAPSVIADDIKNRTIVTINRNLQ